MSYTITNSSIEEPKAIEFETRQEELELINNALKTNRNKTNQEAWSKFHNQYKRFVLAIANKILQDEDEAEDVTQEIFTKLIDQYKQYDQNQPFKPWLSRVTKNFCLNRLKQHKKINQTHYVGIKSIDTSTNYDDYSNDQNDNAYFNAPDVRNPNSLEYAQNQELKKNIDNLLSKLKPEFREVIELKYFEGLKYHEIAEQISIPIGTVMSRIFNAKNKIREEYQKNKNEIPISLEK